MSHVANACTKKLGCRREGVIMAAVDSCINGSQVFQLEILSRFWVNFSVVITAKVNKHSWVWFLVSSVPTRIFTSIIMKCQHFNCSAVVFFRAHHQIKSWIPANRESPWKVLLNILFNYIFHQPDKLNTRWSLIEMLMWCLFAVLLPELEKSQ